MVISRIMRERDERAGRKSGEGCRETIRVYILIWFKTVKELGLTYY